MTDSIQATFLRWFSALERRHLSDLEFAEVRRALRALSALYVARRPSRGSGSALDGAGKRAAFGLFYGPLHFLATQHVVRGLGACAPAPRRILDLGCGTGAAGAAWCLESGARSRISGVDLHPWCVAEANWCWNRFGLEGRARPGRAEHADPPGAGGAVLLAYAVNELGDSVRDRLLERLTGPAMRGTALLVIEPIGRRVVPWWDGWEERFLARGGRSDRWRWPAELPARLRLLDRAAGLDHRELTARSLYLA